MKLYRKIVAWFLGKRICPLCGEIMEIEGLLSDFESICINEECELFGF